MTITQSQISDLAHTDAYTKTESDGTAGSAGAKTDKVSGAVAGNFAGLDAAGNLTDSGSSSASFATASHVHDAADVTTGTFADARIAASNVTQHEAALTITESQISDLTHTDAYTKAESDGTAGSAGAKTDKVSGAVACQGLCRLGGWV